MKLEYIAEKQTAAAAASAAWIEQIYGAILWYHSVIAHIHGYILKRKFVRWINDMRACVCVYALRA